MACIELDEASGRYRIRFRYGGKPFKRSLKTSEEKEARSILGRVEETIRLMERGRLDLPPNADPGVFILSDGKLNTKPTTEQVKTVRELITLYQKSVPKDSKASTTLKTEETHVSHLLKHLRASKAVGEYDWHADHIVAWIRGGKTTLDNGQVLCAKCNLKKKDRLW